MSTSIYELQDYLWTIPITETTYLARALSTSLFDDCDLS